MTTLETERPRPAPEDRSVGDIVASVTEDLSTLVRQEMKLARTEMKEEVTRAGRGAGMLGGAGVAGLLTLTFLSLTLTFLLDLFLPLWASALIVTVLWAAAAAYLLTSGRQELKKSKPTLPLTQQSIKEDVSWTKAHTN